MDLQNSVQRSLQNLAEKSCRSAQIHKDRKPGYSKHGDNSLPPLNSPKEKIKSGFIGPITEHNRRFYILLSMDRYSKWPAASFCTSTDGEAAVKFLEQYIWLNGISKTIGTDKATASTGRFFREFCKKHYIKLINIPDTVFTYIHTPTGMVERGLEPWRRISSLTSRTENDLEKPWKCP